MASSHDADTEGITRRKSLSALAGAGALALAGCTQSTGGGSGDALSGSINIAGSSTVFPLMSAIGEDFAAEHDQVSVDISSTGSGGGFSNYFCVGDTDFNNASRPIQPAEEELCEENGVEYVELIAATDALTIVVNPEADWIDSLTVEGARTDLGGGPRPDLGRGPRRVPERGDRAVRRRRHLRDVRLLHREHSGGARSH